MYRKKHRLKPLDIPKLYMYVLPSAFCVFILCTCEHNDCNEGRQCHHVLKNIMTCEGGVR